MLMGQGQNQPEVNRLLPPQHRDSRDQRGPNSQSASPALQQLVEAMSGGALFSPTGLERVSPGMVIDVASLILQGFHAVPVKLKMLLDRLFSLLNPEEVTAVLRGFGWTIQDYQRGYILKDPGGSNLEKWRMCSPEDEPLILQQFLRFGVTRSLTQQLILQELCDKNAESRQKEHQAAKTINNNKPSEPPRSSSGPPRSPVKPTPSSPVSSSSRASPESTSTRPPHPTPTPPVNGCGGLLPPSPVASLPSPSPLNKLQSMHPFDYRKSDRRTPDASRPPIEKPLPPSMSPMRFPPAGLPAGYPIPPSFGVHPGMNPYQSQQISKYQEAERKAKHEENSYSALNLSRPPDPKQDHLHHDPSMSPMGPMGRRTIPMEDRKYAAFSDDLGTAYVNPATGKKRVQCNVCLKTFCDKGALKIHFSAVHLREMHKCSVPGCNMMFSSRRSRNRHSANPNPKLHTPHIRRKISPHDGRTHQGPVIPFVGHHKSPHHMAPPHSLPMPGGPPFHHFPPPHVMPPELQKLHHQQLELQRFQEMQKLSSLYSRHLSENDAQIKKLDEKERDQQSIVGSEVRSESENDDQRMDVTDDDRSTDNQSSKDEMTTGRKRKSQNPIRITHHDKDEENYSSDDNDEGFPDPMDDEDDDDDLMAYDSTDEVEESSTKKEEEKSVSSNHEEDVDKKTEVGSTSEKGSDAESGNDIKENKRLESGEPEKAEGTTGKIQVRNDLTDLENFSNSHFDDGREGEVGAEDDLAASNPSSPTGSDYQGLLDADIPMDKDNPRRCVDCGKEFQNHFSVKIHYQNVHLKLMHKCTVDGCNAAFPSKRSRDRHSSNLTLHRKLLSTSCEGGDLEVGGVAPPSSGLQPLAPMHENIPAYQNEFLARFLAEQQQRLAFPFLPGLSSGGHGPLVGGAPINSMANINGGGKDAAGVGFPPPFGLLPFNPLLGDLSRLPSLFYKNGPGHQDPAAKSMEENLRKYMAMAGLATKIENHS